VSTLYFDLWAPFIEYSQNERRRMNLPESVMSENLDEIIRRSAIRLEQERLHVAELRAGGAQHASAKATLANGMQALDKLKKYRARFDNVEHYLRLVCRPAAPGRLDGASHRRSSTL
jgi:hypothetical protein